MGFLGSEKLIVGYDLGNEYCQISYAASETGEVETLSQVAGAQIYNIPTVLCKRSGVNQWFYGKEALRYEQDGQGILIRDLLALALDGEPVLIEGESFDPVALLTLFVKRSLGLLSQVGTADRMSALLITCEVLDRRILEVLGNVVSGLRLKAVRISFQSYTESFYSYMIHQPESLWIHESVLFFYRSSCVRVFRMECNRKTVPVVAFIEEQEFPFPEWRGLPEEEGAREEKGAELDGAFLKIAGEVCGDRRIDSVFLIGDGFEEEWMKNSLRLLCRGRRVFQGNNLFSKGACYGMQERLGVSEVGKRHVFLGNEKLKANIGMEVLRQGEKSYYALLDAGVNWYEASNTVEFYLQDGQELELIITSLIGAESRREKLVLSDFPGSVARLQLKLHLESERLLVAEVADLGFGEFRGPSGRSWREDITLY